MARPVSLTFDQDFPYASSPGLAGPVPVAVVVLERIDRTARIPPQTGLVDSGSAASIFFPEHAQALGLEVRGGRAEDLRTAGGDVLRVWHHPLRINCGRFSMEGDVAFTDEKRFPIPIIGRSPFFESLIVAISDRRRRVWLGQAT